MVKSVIFDMDGVIIDSEIVHANANIKIFHELGIETELDYWFTYVGCSLPDIMDKILKDFDLSLSKEELEQCFIDGGKKYVKQSEYIEVPGTIKLIHDLKALGYPLAIASSSSPEAIQRVLSQLKIENCFHSISSGTQVAHSKPEPDVFLQAARLLGTDPAECMVIEDATVGIQAANSAGMASIGFVNPNSGTQDLHHATYIVHHMSECLALIQSH